MEPEGSLISGKASTARSSPLKSKPHVPPKPDFVKSLGPDAVKKLKPTPPQVLSYSQHVQNKTDVVSSFKPSILTPKPSSPATPPKQSMAPAPPPKPKKKSAVPVERQVDGSKPSDVEMPAGVSNEKTASAAIEIPVAKGTARPLGSSPLDSALSGPLRQRDEVSHQPTHFTFVGGVSPLSSPSPASAPPIMTSQLERSSTSRCEVPAPPSSNSDPQEPIPDARCPTVNSPARLGASSLVPSAPLLTSGCHVPLPATPPTRCPSSPKVSRRGNQEVTPPEVRAASPSPGSLIRPEPLPRTLRPESPIARFTAKEVEASVKKPDVPATWTNPQQASPTRDAPTDPAATEHEQVRPTQQVTTPSSPVTAPLEQMTTPSDLNTTPLEQMTTPSDLVTTPFEQMTTPSDPITTPSNLVTTPSDPASFDPTTTPPSPPPLTAGSKGSSKERMPPSPLSLWGIPPPSYSPPPPPLSPLTPLCESILAAFEVNPTIASSSLKEDLLSDSSRAAQAHSDAAPVEEAEFLPHPKRDCEATPTPLDDDIYSVVGQVAPAASVATEGVMESEYSLIDAEDEDIPPEAPQGVTMVTKEHHTQPPLPPVPFKGPSSTSSTYDTLNFTPAQASFRPPPDEQPGYFVVGSGVVGVVPACGPIPDDGSSYSHLSTAAPKMAESNDTHIYSHLADPSCSPSTTAREDGGTSNGIKARTKQDEEAGGHLARTTLHNVTPVTVTSHPPPSSSRTNNLTGSNESTLPSGKTSSLAVASTNKMTDEIDGGVGTAAGKASKGTPSPGQKKRSMTVIPRRAAPPPPSLLPAVTLAPPTTLLATPTVSSASDVPPKRESSKVAADQEVKEVKKPKSGPEIFSKFLKLVRSPSSSEQQPPPLTSPSAVGGGDKASSLKSTTLPSSGRHGSGLSRVAPPDSMGAGNVTPPQKAASSSVEHGEKVEVVGLHSYSVVNINDIIAKRDTHSSLPPPPPPTTAGLQTDKKRTGSPSATSRMGRSGARAEHLYDCVDNVMNASREDQSEGRPAAKNGTFRPRLDPPVRAGSLRLVPTLPPPPPVGSKEGVGRSHIYEALDVSSDPPRKDSKPRSASFESLLSSDSQRELRASPSHLYATVDKARKGKAEEEVPSSTSSPDPPPDKPGEENKPPPVPAWCEDSRPPSSPSPPPVPKPQVSFAISDEGGERNAADSSKEESHDQPDSRGAFSPPPQSIQHTVTSAGTLYAVITKERGERSDLDPAEPVLPLPQPTASSIPRLGSELSMDGTYAVCRGGGDDEEHLPPPPVPPPPFIPPRGQAPTKPLPPLPAPSPSHSIDNQGVMEPTYAVPDVKPSIATTSNQAPPPRDHSVATSTRPPPPPPLPAPPPEQGIMDPEYAAPGLDYIMTMPNTQDDVMGQFRMMVGVAPLGAEKEVSSSSLSTVQVHIETEAPALEGGVSPVSLPPSPAVLTDRADASSSLLENSKPKRSKKHSYEDVGVVGGHASSPPNQSSTLPRKMEQGTGPVAPPQGKAKGRSKTLKPKKGPPPVPPAKGVLHTAESVDAASMQEKKPSDTVEEALPTKSRSGTLYDESGSSDSEYSSEDEGEEGLFSSSTDLMLNETKGNRGKTFYIAQEMLTTERTYVKGLRLLHEDFRAWIISNRENDKPVIPDEILKQILGNIGSLVSLNSGLLNDLEARMENWDNDPRVGDILSSKAPYLKLYTEYISKFDKALKTLEDAKKKYPQFAELVRDFEAEPKCASLPVASYMLEAVQRIPRYRLLLADYVKHLPPDSPDRKPSETALDIISGVASHVNDTMKRMDNFRKVIEVCKKLSGDTGDSLITPYRKLIKEGELLKSCRKEKQMKMFFLFNDLLLYCISHPPGLTYKVVMRIPLDGMKVQLLNDPDMTYGFQIISTCKSFRLEASSAEECQQWIDAIKNAIRENAEIEANKAIVRAKSISKTGRAGTELGHFAPAWLPDNSVSMCQLCSVHFTLTKRRHHCRACGMIFCAECAGYVANLKYLDSKPGRVCQTCSIKLKGGTSSEDISTLISPSKRKKKTSEKQLSMPAVLTEVKARDRSAQISGYLFTHKAKTKRWKKRWYVVYNLVLYEFVRHEDVVAKRTITLPSYKVIAPSEGKEDTLIFSLKHPGTTEYYFKAENVEQLKKWCEVLSRAVQGDCTSIPESSQDE